MTLKRQLGLTTAMLVVVASMIGTGIFVTTGEVLAVTGNATLVLFLWLLGGLVALSGTLSYAELATMMPHVGGEYVYLRKMYGLLPSFLSGWVSLIVGFSASIAASALAVSEYSFKLLTYLNPNSSLAHFLTWEWGPKLIAAGAISFFGILHMIGIKWGARVQNFLTIIKIGIVALFILFGFAFADWNAASRLIATYEPSGSANMGTLGLALLMVMFAYSGWNGASYIGGEIKNPGKNLPKALFWGTFLTMILYVFINVVFLLAVDGTTLMTDGKNTAGALAALNLFGKNFGVFFNLGILLILLSSISVQLMIGPRVYYAMAQDHIIFEGLAKVSEKFHTPVFAIGIQILISVFYVLLANVTFLIIHMSFALSIFPLLTVIGLFKLRKTEPNAERPYKVAGYPYVPLFFIIMNIFMMISSLIVWTKTSLTAIAVLLVGIPVFYLWRAFVAKVVASKSPTPEYE
ncbi:MAG: amino acid permease [Candidatus Hydrogenedentota bacterium]|nr:MAG: amino acid permease [Candidatus Hydrogenedentota bacterium]